MDVYRALLLRGDIVRFAASLTHDAWLAEDLTQHAYLRLLEHSQTLEDATEGYIRAYLMKTVKNAYIDHIRKHQKISLPGEMPEEGALDDHSALMVSSMLDKLPENMRQTIRMRYEEGFNSTEIASRLGIPAATVRTRLRTAIAYLKKLEEDEK